MTSATPGSEVYDVIVVGAGVEGSFTAYHLAKQGKKTLLLEQFPLPHTRGSSHGQSRIIRKAYCEKHFANMMVEAYPLWYQLEKETDTKLYKNTGMVLIGEQGGEEIKQTGAALSFVNCKHEYFNPKQLRKAYPMMTFPEDFGGVLDHEAGILHADKCVAKLQEMFQRFGGILHDAEKVTKIHPGDVVTIHTSKGRYLGNSLVLAAGPWAPKMTQELGLNLPLEPLCITVSYWKQLPGDDKRHQQDNMPAFIVQQMTIDTPTAGPVSIQIYGLPANEYPSHVKPQCVRVTYFKIKLDCPNPHTLESGMVPFAVCTQTSKCDFYGFTCEEYPDLVKICSHEGCPSDPDSRDAEQQGVWKQEAMEKFVYDHFPGLESKPSIVEKCMYTVTPDEHFFLDTHPKWKNIVIGAGFSGHGFKLAPVVGKVLSELAIGKTPSYDLSYFRLDRFSQQSKL